MVSSTSSAITADGRDERQKTKSNSSVIASPSRKPTDFAILKFIGILTFFLVLHVAGIYYFTRGFLLTRLVFNANSNCLAAPVDLPVSRPGEFCSPQQFKKAIIVVIDALRYDFTVPYPEDQSEFYHNAF